MFQLRLHAGGFHPLVVSHQLLLRFIRQLYSKGTRIFLVASYHYVSIKIVAKSISVMNPHLIKNFGNNSLQKVKSDPADARKIARYTLDNWTELRQYSGMDNTRTQLKSLNSQFSLFMKQTVAAKANLIALLDNTYPGVNKLFNSPPREDGSEKWVDYAYSFWHVERLQIYPQGSTYRLCMR